jgi:hypothetical protein
VILLSVTEPIRIPIRIPTASSSILRLTYLDIRIILILIPAWTRRRIIINTTDIGRLKG